jgi:hypothetical protein
MKRYLSILWLALFLIIQNGAPLLATTGIIPLDDIQTTYNLPSTLSVQPDPNDTPPIDVQAMNLTDSDMRQPDVIDYVPTQEDLEKFWEQMDRKLTVSASAPDVGHQRTFYEGERLRNPVNATLIAKSANYLIYVNNLYNSSAYPQRQVFFPQGSTPSDEALDFADQLDKASSFMLDQHPSNYKYFGQPYDIDSNGGVIVLITNFYDPSMQSAIGYFTSANFFQKSSDNPNSNVADMLYVEAATLENINTVVVIHELQHLINFSYKFLNNRNNPSSAHNWLNEGLSNLTKDILYEAYPTQQTKISNTFFVREYGPGGFTYIIPDYSYNNVAYDVGLLQVQHYWLHRGAAQSQPLFSLVSDPRGGNETKDSLGDNYLKNIEKPVTSDSYNQFLTDFLLTMAVDSEFSSNGTAYDYRAPKEQGQIWLRRTITAKKIESDRSFSLSTGATAYRPDLMLFSQGTSAPVTFKITDKNVYSGEYPNQYFIIYPSENPEQVTSYSAWQRAPKTFKEIPVNTVIAFDKGGPDAYFAILAVGQDQPVNATAQFSVSNALQPDVPNQTDPPAIVILESTLAAGNLGVPYNQTVHATGSEPITWALTEGSLPPGLSLSPETGLISGTPTDPGLYRFTLVASNPKETSAPVIFSITVKSDTNTDTAVPIPEKVQINRTSQGAVQYDYDTVIPGGSNRTPFTESLLDLQSPYQVLILGDDRWFNVNGLTLKDAVSLGLIEIPATDYQAILRNGASTTPTAASLIDQVNMASPLDSDTLMSLYSVYQTLSDAEKASISDDEAIQYMLSLI